VHFDAHLDYMPFVHGLEYTNAHAFRHISRMDQVTSLTQVGIRSLRNTEQMHRDTIAGNRVVTIEEFRDVGPGGIAEVVPDDARCYVSLDIDVLDLSLVPGCVSAEPYAWITPASGTRSRRWQSARTSLDSTSWR
jgi:agmatinase